jgi:hypothetical protein
MISGCGPDVSINVCQPLETYGGDYVGTCRVYVDQCSSQQSKGAQTYELNIVSGKTLKGLNAKGCLNASVRAALERGPLPYEKIPRTFRQGTGAFWRRWPDVTAFRCIQRDASAPDADAVAARVLVKHKLLKRGDSVRHAYDARVVDAFDPSRKGAPLVIILLDQHTDDTVQHHLARLARKLHAKGLSFFGVEGNTVGRRLQGGHFGSRGWDFCRDGRLARRLDCAIGSKTVVLGVESPEMLLLGAFELRNAREGLKGAATKLSESKESACRLFREAVAAAHFIFSGRSYDMLENQLEQMKAAKRSRGVLVIGAGHLRDLQAAFRSRGIGYVALAVPGLDTAVEADKKESDAEMKDPKPSDLRKLLAACQDD